VTRARVLGVLVSLFVISGIQMVPAQAQTEEEEGDLPVAELGIIPDGGSIPVEFSPAGCVGKSNNPHRTWGGSSYIIKGVSQIDCLSYVSSLRTTAQLWRKRWWGYEKVGTKGDNTDPPPGTSARQVKASGVFYGCENNTWRLTSDHWSVENGKTYTASTIRYASVTTC
jgi:hypothetical protein